MPINLGDGVNRREFSEAHAGLKPMIIHQFYRPSGIKLTTGTFCGLFVVAKSSLAELMICADAGPKGSGR